MAFPSNTTRIIGWVLSALVVALFFFSASGKLIGPPEVNAMFDKYGLRSWQLFIGILEVAVALIYIIPRTHRVGTLLITGYLGGAMVTHMTAGEDPWFALGVGIVAWIGVYLRDPSFFTARAQA